jgi:acetylornithine deacetylase/succinyl-diaminopimelate desuccinylase-like protein
MRRVWIVAISGVVSLSAGLVAALGVAQSGHGDSEAPGAARLLTELIRLDTSNPPGHEERIAQFLAQQFQPLGFQIQIVPTPEPGKAHFIARLKGDGSKRPVLLAAHADVVGVEREKWTVDPFAGLIKDGYVYGRGAMDFKGGIAVFAQAVMDLARTKVPLARDVIFLSEADEEGGRYNTSWLADSHWDQIDCEFALNEGGWIMREPRGKVRYISVSTADKGSLVVALTAKGTSTHASMPRADNAIFALTRALGKLADYHTKVTFIPSTREFFTALAGTSEPPMSATLRGLLSSDTRAVEQADRDIRKDPLLHALVHNTIAPVMLNAGFRFNVIPGSAEAILNCRLIPGTDPDGLVREIQGVIADPQIGVAIRPFPGTTAADLARRLREFRETKPSSPETNLYRALAKEAHAMFPGALVTPYLFQAGTDAVAWRSRGVPVYGIYPYPIDPDDLTRMHGNDERVSLASLRQGTAMIYQTLVDVAGYPRAADGR